MLIIFKSPADGDVIMFEKNAKEMLRILGKDPTEPKGILTVEQLPAAIDAVKAAIAADKARQAERSPDEDDPDQDVKPEGAVSFFQRAVPLLEMLERALKDREPVTWGA